MFCSTIGSTKQNIVSIEEEIEHQNLNAEEGQQEEKEQPERKNSDTQVLSLKVEIPQKSETHQVSIPAREEQVLQYFLQLLELNENYGYYLRMRQDLESYDNLQK